MPLQGVRSPPSSGARGCRGALGRLPARQHRRARRDRRARRVGRAPSAAATAASRSCPRGRSLLVPPPYRASRAAVPLPTRSASGSSAARPSSRTCSPPRRGRPASSRRRSGSWSGGPRHQRHVRAAARAAPGPRAARSRRRPPLARRCRPGAPRSGRWSLRADLSRARRRTGRARPRSPSCCSSATASSRATRPGRGVPGGFAALYPVLAHLETPAPPGAATSSTVSAARSSPCRRRRPAARAALGRAGRAALVLAATDPASPWGAALPWPRREDADAGAAPRARPRRLARPAPRRAGPLRRSRRQGFAAAARAGRRVDAARPRGTRRSGQAADACRGSASSASTVSRWLARQPASC